MKHRIVFRVAKTVCKGRVWPPKHLVTTVLLGKDIKDFLHRSKGIKLGEITFSIAEELGSGCWSYYTLNLIFANLVGRAQKHVFKGHFTWLHSGVADLDKIMSNYSQLWLFLWRKISRSDEEIRCRASVTKFADIGEKVSIAYQAFSL